MSNDSNDEDLNLKLTTILCSFSIVLCFFFVLILNKKHSNYARIVRHIVMSEGIYIFCFLEIIVRGRETYLYKLKNFSRNVFHFITINFFNKETNNNPIDSEKADPMFNLMDIFCLAGYYSMEVFSLTLSIFICLELILILRNPIAQMKNRLKPYFIISTFLAITVFVMICTLDFSSIDPKSTIEQYMFSEKFQLKFSRALTLIFYLIFVVLGFVSIVFLFARFCYGKTLLQNFRNLFVIRHFLYVIFYSIALGPLKIYILLKYIGDDFLQKFNLNFYFCLYFNISVGITMFFIRSSETKFYQTIFCFFCKKNKKDGKNNNYFVDVPLTSIISRNMNLEFMCCILYGLSDIFNKNEKKQKSSIYEDCTFNIIDFDKSKNLSSNLLQFEKTYSKEKSLLSQNIGKKDFKRAKKHQIRYKKIFNDSIDFDNLEVEVSSVKKKKKVTNTTFSISESVDLEDSEAKSKIGEINKKQNHDALVIEYCPRVFRELRKLDEYTAEELDNSLNPIMNKEQMSKIKESEGKSGSFFFFSHDGRFLIKTITNNELNTMIGKFMDSYYEYMNNTPDSLIARVYGIYTIIIKGVSKINIILMENLMVIDRISIKRIFDLKGSRVERKTKNIEKCDNLKTLKDLDFLWMTKVEEDLISFTKDSTDILISQLAQDVAILRELYVMDYSLLLIIVHFPNVDDPNYEDVINLFGDRRCCRRIFKSENNKYIYIMGIIDYLQKFNSAKFLENKYKSILYGDEIRYVSAVDPTIYSERMFEFAKDFIFVTNASQ